MKIIEAVYEKKRLVFEPPFHLEPEENSRLPKLFFIISPMSSASHL